MGFPTTHDSLPEHMREDSGLHPVQDHKYPVESPAFSTKEPVLHQGYYDLPGRTQRPERRIGGLKRWQFWSLIALISLIVIGASVGGAIGGTKAAQSTQSSEALSAAQTNEPTSTRDPLQSSAISGSPSATPATSSSTSSPSSAPTSIVTLDCPNSDGASFTPNSPGGDKGKYTFVKRCGVEDTDGRDLIEAFVPDLNNCVALCSNWNYFQTGGDLCTSIVFNSAGASPGNCWAKTGTQGKGTNSKHAVAFLST